MKTIYPNAEHGIVNRAKGSIFSYQGWGTVTKDENGTLYAVSSAFRVAHICPFGKTTMYVSKNEGKTWSPPIVINDTYLDDRDAGILYMGNGRMLVTWWTHSSHEYTKVESRNELIKYYAEPEALDATVGILKGHDYLPEEDKLAGSYLRVSEDYGITWNETIRIPITAPHGPSLCKDGSLIYLGIKIYDDDRIHIADMSPDKDIAYLYRSRDGGYTWTVESKISSPKWLKNGQRLSEPHVLELPNGNLLGAFRIEGIFTVALTISKDGGKTWEDVQSTGVSGSPPHLMIHSSGAIICSFGRREVPCGIRAIVSYDLGNTWTEKYVIAGPKREDDYDLGYPSTVELSDGSLLTTYYQKYEDDKKCSFLYSKWRLEDKK